MAPENGSSNGTGTATGTPEFMAAQPKLSKQHSRRSLASFIRHGQPNLVRATFDNLKKMNWQQKLSMIFVAILWRSGKLLKLIGFLVEWTLNLLLLNSGLLRLLWKLVIFKWDEIFLPQEGTEEYLSLIGLLDRRTTLFVDTSPSAQANSTTANTEVFPSEDVGARSTADVCIMAAKLAYENPAVVEKAVVNDWKMHFVKFYNCWNEYQQMWNTQAFVVMDKSEDANAVVVSFRGTEPFNAYDWSTDLDFSWVKLEGLGGVHLGFLEALGLATRDSLDTFVNLRNNAITTRRQMEQTEHREALASPNIPPSPHHKTRPEIINTMATSGLPDSIVNDDNKLLAYDDITKQVALLLHDNPKAKLFITGHSLGGALAALYATMLNYTGETEVASKIGAVYTFGQPRVGDADFAEYAAEHLAGRYFRVVYCNDVVPRVPFDNELFAFKHFGNCDYFNSVYDGFTLSEEPNPNFFGIARLLTMHLNAMWELLQGVVLIAAKHGEGFRENELGMIARIAGVLLPGVAAHNPCNYVNSVRLGPLPLAVRLKGDIADLAEELHLMQDNVKDIAYILLTNLPQLPGMDVVRFAAQKLFR